MKSRFSKFNDGMLYICEAKIQETNFGIPQNIKKTEDLTNLAKLAYEEKSKRDEDIDFAESRGRMLSLKVKTRECKAADSMKKVVIGNMLYSILKMDHDRTNQEMYFYLEEERKIT